jgi:uncharacterized protein
MTSEKITDKGKIRIDVKVTPKAAAAKVVDKDGQLSVYVTVAPEDGKANKAVIKLLAKRFGVAPSRISVIRGETSRHKTIEIEGIED